MVEIVIIYGTLFIMMIGALVYVKILDKNKKKPADRRALKSIIRLRMYEKEMNQNDLSKLLEIPESNLSEFLSGKREINFNMAKALYSKLNIDADIIFN